MADWVEVVAGEKDHRYERAALIFRTLGWLSLFWAFVVSMWIWTGLKAGSDLWLLSTIVLFVVGAMLLGLSRILQGRAARLVEVPKAAEDDRTRAA